MYEVSRVYLYIPAKRLSANLSSRELLPTPVWSVGEGRGEGGEAGGRAKGERGWGRWKERERQGDEG